MMNYLPNGICMYCSTQHPYTAVHPSFSFSYQFKDDIILTKVDISSEHKIFSSFLLPLATPTPFSNANFITMVNNNLCQLLLWCNNITFLPYQFKCLLGVAVDWSLVSVKCTNDSSCWSPRLDLFSLPVGQGAEWIVCVGREWDAGAGSSRQCLLSTERWIRDRDAECSSFKFLLAILISVLVFCCLAAKFW